MASTKFEHRGWTGVDLDGTLADYQGWKGIDHIGEPVKPMLLRVHRMLAAGKTVKIFTARVWPLGEILPEEPRLMDLIAKGSPRESEAAQAAIHIQEWCKKHVGQVLPITCAKDMAMIQLFDDRCVQIELNTGRRLDGVDDLK